MQNMGIASRRQTITIRQELQNDWAYIEGGTETRHRGTNQGDDREQVREKQAGEQQRAESPDNDRTHMAWQHKHNKHMMK